MDSVSAEKADDDEDEITGFSEFLEEKGVELRLAVSAVHEVTRVMDIVNERMSAFLSDILARRARGAPRLMLDAKEARDFLRHTALNVDRARALCGKENQDRALQDSMP